MQHSVLLFWFHTRRTCFSSAVRYSFLKQMWLTTLTTSEINLAKLSMQNFVRRTLEIEIWFVDNPAQFSAKSAKFFPVQFKFLQDSRRCILFPAPYWNASLEVY